MEKPISFNNAGKVIYGILHLPEHQPGNEKVGVVFLSGWSGYRIGPHRMFVKTARGLSQGGYYSLRFDFRGRGDSEGETKDATIGTMISDAKKAINFFLKEIKVDKVVLLGICSGGNVAIGGALTSPKVDSLILWSAPLFGDATGIEENVRRSLFYFKGYLKKMFQLATWRKLVSFRVNLPMITKVLFGHYASKKDEDKEETGVLEQFGAFKGKVLFIYGGSDPHTKEAVKGYSSFCEEAGIESKFGIIKDSNHSFYSLKWEDEVITLTARWLKERYAS